MIFLVKSVQIWVDLYKAQKLMQIPYHDPAGLNDFRFHDLKHTFASWLVMAGVELTTASRLLGHKSLTMTLRYSLLAPSHMLKAVAVLKNGYDLVTLGEKEGNERSATT